MLLSRTGRGISPALSVFSLLALCVGLFRWPETAADGVRGGLDLCGSLIIPSLFPFFVLSGLTVSLGVSALLGRLASPVMGPLFHQGGAGASALTLGLIGGYPVGAKTVCGLYREGQCGRAQAEGLLAFCNNCGPAFVVGAAGVGLFHSARTGLLLMAIQVLSACCVGFLFRPEGRAEKEQPVPAARPKGFAECFTTSVGQAATAVVNICAYVVFFQVLTRLLDRSGLLTVWAELLPCPRSWGTGLTVGALELSNGIAALGGTPDAIIPVSFLLSWGGLCVHCQTISLIQEERLGAGRYLLGKLTQAFIAAALACLALRLFPSALSVAETAGQFLPASRLPVAGHRTGQIAPPLWVGLVVVTGLLYRKRAGNHRGDRV